MKKMGKVCLLALAAVLVLSFVGCKAMDESVEEHNEGADKYEHVWEARYDVEKGKYIRSALQFGSGDDKLEKVEIKVKSIYPQHGKAGIMFGLHDEKSADGENTLYNTYLMGIGEKVGGSAELVVYIDYMKGLVSLKEGEATSDKVGGKQYEVTGNQSVIIPGRTSGTPLTVVAEISYDMSTAANENEGTYTVVLKDESGKELATAEWVHGETVAGSTLSVAEQAKGTIASYGMVSGAIEGEKKVDITWNVDKDSIAPATTVLSADVE